MPGKPTILGTMIGIVGGGTEGQQSLDDAIMTSNAFFG
jgi:hypothetical protein